MDTQHEMIISQTHQLSNFIITISQNQRNPISDRLTASTHLDIYTTNDRTPKRSTVKFAFGTIRYQKTHRPWNKNIHLEIIITFLLPAWLSNRAWQWIQYTKYSGWRTIIQTFRIVNNCSPIFEFSREGNVKALRELLGSKKAFLTDRANDSRESTALHVRQRTQLTHIAESKQPKTSMLTRCK